MEKSEGNGGEPSIMGKRREHRRSLPPCSPLSVPSPGSIPSTCPLTHSSHPVTLSPIMAGIRFIYVATGPPLIGPFLSVQYVRALLIVCEGTIVVSL